jgi:ornithine--oxo-acid transaminase
LFVADEVQTGCGRTGKMLAVDHDGVKPDILIMGKVIHLLEI